MTTEPIEVEAQTVALPPSEWRWFGHAAHLCVARNCQFHLATQVGPWLVSTVGEYVPDETMREIFAKMHGKPLEGKGDQRYADYMNKIGFEEIGCGRKYETMVFRSTGFCECGCGLPVHSGAEEATDGYNSATSATKGHMAMCAEYAKKVWYEPNRND